MCGIAGIVAVDREARIDPARLRRMRDVLRHRGPDEAGLHIRSGVGLAHRRLSIIDLKSGQQPMSNEDGSVWITYNGEIYNFRALRSSLMAYGMRFRTRSDTEVILKAYEAYGEDCVRHLRGMFAFAIWDERRQQLFLARDRMGIKPLYYQHGDSELVFGSEIKAILAAGRVVPRLNDAALPELLANRYVGGEETLYRGVRKLLPAHWMTWNPAAGIRVSRYWQLPGTLDQERPTLHQQARELRGRLEEAIESHLVSDVALGVFLSGGVDSSAIAALMSRMVPEPVKAFSIGFANQHYSELRWARLAAQAAGAEYREIVLHPDDFFAALPWMIWHEDEPIAFPSSIPLYYVSRLAQRHVKVVMTGEGSDELFLGYDRYRFAAWNLRLGRVYQALVPRTLRAGVRRAVCRLPARLARYPERSFLALPADLRSLFWENFSVFAPRLQERLGALQGPAGREPYIHAMHAYAAAPGGVLERLSHADLQTYLVELLMKQDQMSMAASVESRVPFLDHRFVEFAAAMPARYKLRGWRTKAVLREAVSDVVPEAILRRRKMGFPTPIPDWFRGAYSSLVEEFVCGERARSRRLFDAGVVGRLVQEHRDGRRNHADRLWLLMNLEIWERIFVDGEPPGEVLARARTASVGGASARSERYRAAESEAAARVASGGLG